MRAISFEAIRRVPVVFAAFALWTSACSPADDGPPTYFEDPDLQRIYSRMMEEMAPDRGWERVRYIAFDRVVDRGGPRCSTGVRTGGTSGAGCTAWSAPRANRRSWPSSTPTTPPRASASGSMVN